MLGRQVEVCELGFDSGAGDEVWLILCWLTFLVLDDVLGRGVVDLKTISCLLYSLLLLVYQVNKLLTFHRIHCLVAAFGLGRGSVGMLDARSRGRG